MKKLVFFACIALVALWSVSCNKELKPEETVNPVQKAEKVKMTFTAGIQTKAFVEEGQSSVDIKWETTDHIAVWDGTEWCDFSATSVDGSTAVFEGEITPDEAFAITDFKAVYPFSAITDASSSSISVTVPSAQVVPSGGVVDPEALVSVATCSNEGLLSFEQVCALVKINLTHSGMSAITLEGTGLAGTVVCADDGSVSSASALEDTISLTSEDGEFAFSGASADYYVAVLPGTSAPLKVGLVCESDGYTGYRSASSVTFAQGKAKVFIKDSAIEGEYNIYTPSQLLNCAAHWSSSFTSTVNICADIDMDGIVWEPKNFGGTFDGKEHNIYNLNIEHSSNACFINTLTGTMKDVVFGSSDGSNYDGTSAIVQNNPEDDGSDWRYAGLVTRLDAAASMTGVVSYIPVTVAATSISKTRVGGLVGIVAKTSSGVSMSDCENHGDISILAESQAASGAAGGIVGWVDASISCSNLVNNGDLTINNSYVTYTAGILSCDDYGSTVKACTNNGNIVVSGSGSRAMCVAGIVGDATNSNVVSCTNSGKIELSIDGEMKVGGIIGRAYKGCTITGCTNSSTAVIVSNPASATKRTFMGGIVGNSPAANNTELVIENCKNYASLTTSNAQVASIAGIAGFLNGAGKVIIRGCENHGDMSNANDAAKNGSAAAAAYVSGIAAFLSTSMLDGSCIDGCVNRGAISSINRNINYIGAILPILQSSNVVSVKDCHNYGTVTRNVTIRTQVSSNNDTYYSVGGIIGKVDGANAEVTGCVNHAGATVWSNASGGSAYPKLGGIIAYIVSAKCVSECRNEASVTYDNTATGGSFGVFGGVLGHVYATEEISNCYNSGAVSSNRTQQNRLGGIVGNLNNSPVTGCTNEGSVTLSNSSTTAQAVGGIVGFAEGSDDDAKDISGNVNTGAISMSINSTNNRCCVGGIVGIPLTAFNVSDNENRGAVSGNNANTSTPYCYVGGIIGQDKSATNVSTINGNKSYGEVKNETGNASYSAAGGLVGNCDVSGMSGSVFCTVSGTNAGAVAGINTKAITATLCDAVTVNGVTKANASDEAAWLCPSNTGTITPTYVAHSSSE